MQNLIREIKKILTAAESYHTMGRDFPLFGVGNLQDYLEALLKEMRGKFATISWTVNDLDEYDIPEDAKMPFLAERARKLQDLLIERGNDAIETFMEESGYKSLEDDDDDD